MDTPVAPITSRPPHNTITAHNRYTGEGGDSTLSAEELFVITKKCGMDVTAKEVRRVVNYLDGNGNSELDHEELNNALRRARREAAPR